MFEPQPAEWHRAPADDGRCCATCGCPKVKLARGTAVHRAIAASDPARPNWQKRFRTRRGEELTVPVYSRKQLAAIGQPRPPRKWPPGPRRATIDQARRIAELVANGAGLAQAASLVGIVPATARLMIMSWPSLWEQTLAEARARVASGETIDLAIVPRPEPTEAIRRDVRRACALLAGGMRSKDAAAAMDVAEHRLRIWQERFPTLWAEEKQLAMEAARSLLYARPPAIGQSSGPHDRALARLQTWADALGLPVLPVDGELTLAAFFEKVYRPQRLLGASRATCDRYRSVIRTLSRYAGKTVAVRDLSNELVADFMASAIAKHKSRATANLYRAHLLALCRLAKRRGLLEVVPDVEKLREIKRAPQCWLADEFARILAAAGQVEGMIAGIPAGDWWRALLLTAYDTGLRVGALMQLRGEDLDVRGGWLRVQGDTQKQAADQLFRLAPDTLMALDRIDTAGGDLLFPRDFDPRGPERRWQVLRRGLRSILAAAGLPTRRLDLFHKIRKTTATYANAAGVNATLHLGHSCERVTRAYLDPRIAVARRAADVLPRPWSNPAHAT